MKKIFSNLSHLISEYTPQFWLLFVGMLISSIGSSMIWPFFMLYVSKSLQLPLTQIATLMTINATAGLIFSFLAGPIVDRVGRKWMMVISLIGNGLMYILLSQAHTYLGFAVAQALMGSLGPIYRVGADAMIADLIPTEKRSGAYSIMRMSQNAGIAIGPAIGGLIATRSYSTAFYLAASGMAIYGLLLAFRARETLPRIVTPKIKQGLLDGYGKILRHAEFIGFVGAFVLPFMLATLIWVLMPVYANTNFGVSEGQYGFIATTNALMVVFLQYLVTSVTKKYKPLPVMAVGSLFYTIATALVAVFTGFWGFWLCMVIMTVGELVIVPTASTYTADLAPLDMRGRYMSIFGLTWSISAGVAPVFGGFLNDNLGPQSIWFGGGIIGVISIAAFLLLAAKYGKQRKSNTEMLEG